MVQDESDIAAAHPARSPDSDNYEGENLISFFAKSRHKTQSTINKAN